MRRFSTILVFLVLGAVINVAVAFGCVLWHGPVYQEWRPVRHPRLASVAPVDEGMTQVEVETNLDIRRRILRGRPEVLLATRRFGHEIVSRGLRFRSATPDYSDVEWWPDDAVVEGPVHAYAVAAGWPLLALSAWRAADDPSEVEFPRHPSASRYRWGLLWTEGNDVVSFQPKVGLIQPGEPRFLAAAILPLRPIWVGFALNTILYASGLWSVVMAVTMRSRIRRRRGQCGRCGYPRGASSTCPECGSAVTPIATSAPPHASPPSS